MNKSNVNRIIPFIKKNRFYNHSSDTPESFVFQTVPSFLSSLYGRKKRQPENKSEWICTANSLDSSIEPVITWIGHASFLIQVGGINIITDPIFGSASPFFPRILPPGINLAQLPPLDLVLLSHNHRDHCDLKSLQALQKAHPALKLLVPVGDKQWLEKKGLTAVIEHTWWQNYTITSATGAEITCTFLPAHHWSAQGVFDRNKSLWGSWMIKASYSNHALYFAGDSAYADHFKHIAAEFPTISTALMPIAPGEPHPWMRKSHMDAHQAVQAFIDLNATHFIPMHWGTFQFGLDTFAGPLERLNKAWNDYALHASNKKLTIAKVGQQLKI